MSLEGVPFAERARTPEAQVLLAALHQDPARLDASPIDTLTPAQWERLVSVAREQRVRVLLMRRLHQEDRLGDIPSNTLASLRADCRCRGPRSRPPADT